MKKVLFLICSLIILLLIPSCVGDGSSELCKTLGSHDLQYVIEEDVHWLKCQQEGCAYKTKPEAHSGGTATCGSKAKCTACGALYGDYAEQHDMKYVSDGEHTHTYRCAFSGCLQMSNDSQPHSGGIANCKSPAICEICGGTYGEIGTHILDSDGVSCAGCKENYFALTLEFQLREDKSSYVLTNGKNCTAETVTIPSEYKGLPVTEIGKAAFMGNWSIKAVVIPDSVEIIGESAFNNTFVESVSFGNSVKKIGAAAFNIGSLTSFVLPASLTEIGQKSFSGVAIKSIVIPDNVKLLGESAFACSELETVTIGSGLKSISENAFSETKLETIVIPANIEKIEYQAFAYCESLRTVIFSDTLEYIDAEVFLECSALEYNDYEGMNYLGTATNPYFALMGSKGATRLITHTDTVIYATKALFNYEDIVSVEVGPNVRFIGYYALGGMDNLEEITVHSDNPYYYAINNLLVDKRTKIPALGCKTSVIPSDGSIDKVNLDIFSYISSIKTVYIPGGIKTVEVCFQGMTGLEAIVLGSDVEQLIIGANSDLCKRIRENCFAIYRCHTEEQWKKVKVENPFGQSDATVVIGPVDCYGNTATHYFYSETEPTGEGNYWHYVDGVPTPWEDSTSSETEG